MARRKKPWLASRHPARQLGRLAGRWSVEATFPGADRPVRGSTSMRWLAKNALMTVRSSMQGGGIPTSISVLGADDANNRYTMLYSDDRGVTRTYAMKLTRTRWTLERKAPRFSQRFIGRIAGNGRVIRGAWEKSSDGRRWTHDFDLVYTRKL